MAQAPGYSFSCAPSILFSGSFIQIPTREKGLAILGILNIIFGLILLFNPLIGALFLPILLGIFAVIGGSLAAIRAFVSRHQEVPAQPPGAWPA